jgi:hypothetical protein
MFKKILGGKGGDADLYRPRMPEVDTPTNIEEVFGQARQAANGELRPPNFGPSERYLVVVTPGRMLMQRPCPPAGSMPAAQVASMEKLLPPVPRRNVAAIAYTELRAVTTDLGQAIPFAGMLLGIAYIGHAVWVFEGHPSALAAGCRDADLLLVDSGMLPHLAADWIAVASGVMRHKEIYVHDRATFKLARVAAK